MVALDGDKVEKMDAHDRKNLSPIPEELNLSDTRSDARSSEDTDFGSNSDASMHAQYETDTLSQDLADNLSGQVIIHLKTNTLCGLGYWDELHMVAIIFMMGTKYKCHC